MTENPQPTSLQNSSATNKMDVFKTDLLNEFDTRISKSLKQVEEKIEGYQKKIDERLSGKPMPSAGIPQRPSVPFSGQRGFDYATERLSRGLPETSRDFSPVRDIMPRHIRPPLRRRYDEDDDDEPKVRTEIKTVVKERYPDWFSVCPDCGTKMGGTKYVCSECGAPCPLPSDKNQFCWNCGTKLSPLLKEDWARKKQEKLEAMVAAKLNPQPAAQQPAAAAPASAPASLPSAAPPATHSEEPKTEEPKAEEPKKEEPKKEEPEDERWLF